MMYWGNNGVSGWGYALMSVSMVLFWGLVIVGIVVLVRHLGADGAQAQRPSVNQGAPERILAERFARGEIDDHEYRSRLDVLRGNHPADTDHR